MIGAKCLQSLNQFLSDRLQKTVWTPELSLESFWASCLPMYNTQGKGLEHSLPTLKNLNLHYAETQTLPIIFTVFKLYSLAACIAIDRSCLKNVSLLKI